MIPQSFIDDLLYRLDITDVVGRYVQLKAAGANLQGLCPFHNEKSPSFTVSPSKQFYHCFGCGAHGNAVGFVMEHLGMTFPEAVESLAGNLGIDVPHEKGMDVPAEVRSEREDLVELLTRAANYYKAQLKKSPVAVDYLKNRGLTGQVAARYGMGYAPDGYQNLEDVIENYTGNTQLDLAGLTKISDSNRRYDAFRGRIMFPIRNAKGQVIGFGGRVLGDEKPKYLNSPETPVFSKGHEVYGLFEARQAIHKMGYALVTEGYMDVVALAQWGFENAVATLGTAVTPDHVLKLFKQTDRLVFAFDGDNAGQKAAWRALQACLPHVSENKRADFIFLPAEHDPDSFIRTEGPDGFEAMVAQAAPLSEFLARYLERNYPLQQIEGSAAAISFLKPLIVQMQPTVYRSSLLRALANLLGATPMELGRHLGLKSRDMGGDYFSPKNKGQFQGKQQGGKKFGKFKDEPLQNNWGPRPTAKSPLLSLAARVIRAPQLVDLCNSLLDLYEREKNPAVQVHSFVHLLEKIRSDPNLLEARLQHAFNDEVHQNWVNSVLKEARSLDDSLDFETELRSGVYQCSELWFKAELERLTEEMPTQGEQLRWYHECMQRFQELKQKRVNQL
ncbi:DNA primase [Limnobacter sp.]|uniref:DNA primase n=1 Tax=Limnobacter sp. TaxID=2003368 RepID=UPI002FE214ED